MKVAKLIFGDTVVYGDVVNRRQFRQHPHSNFRQLNIASYVTTCMAGE